MKILRNNSIKKIQKISECSYFTISSLKTCKEEF